MPYHFQAKLEAHDLTSSDIFRLKCTESNFCQSPVTDASKPLTQLSSGILHSVADPEILKSGENTVSASSSYIANAHNELQYMPFIRVKAAYFKKNSEPIGEATIPFPFIRH